MKLKKIATTLMLSAALGAPTVASALDISGIVTSLFITETEIAVTTTGGFCYSVAASNFSAATMSQSVSDLVRSQNSGAFVNIDCRQLQGIVGSNIVVTY